MPKKLTTEEFVKKARAKHGTKYGYANVKYINTRTNVNITCLKCQKDFPQRPTVHLQGSGCPTCVIEATTMTLAEFIQKARAKHGTKYGYANVKYINTRTNVNITCLKCQKDFPQRPTVHLQGSGCPTCVIEATTMTLAEFIQKARAEHGTKYDYGNVKYVNSATKVDITCLACDDNFPQTPNVHLQGSGCPTCGLHKTIEATTMTLAEFIQKARAEHGTKYDYGNVKYVNSATKVDITCLACDDNFPQTPNVHLQGSGCPTCGLHKTIEATTMTLAEFIQKARAEHGTKYDYGNVKYVNSATKVDITCLACDDNFPQTPRNHLQGYGCPKCGLHKRIESQRMSQDEFIQKAKAEHGDLYDYDNVKYINTRTNVNITCLKCQKDFPQTPNVHLQGSGCPKCGIESQRMSQAEFIQKAKAKHGTKYDYGNVKYVGTATKVDITCLACDDNFPQTPHNHLQGSGCPTCVNKTEKIICDVLQSVLDTLKVKHMGYNVTEDIGRMDIVVLNQNTDIVCFIEVDGGQHFVFVEIFKNRSVEDTQNSDLEKHKRAKIKGYRTIRIDQEWIWNSHKKGDNSWVECLKKTILKLEQNIEPDIKEMFLSNKVHKYYSHPCYQYEKDIENLYKDVEQLYVQ